MALLFVSAPLTEPAEAMLVSIVAGEVTIKRATGWNQDVLAELSAASGLLSQAARLRNLTARAELERLAYSLVEGRAAELEMYVAETTPSAAPHAGENACP